jgi:putative inorganic carbon (HCO3(-)) transporter
MRDILVTLIVFGSLFKIYKQPYIGAVMWVWISVMNPHSQGWGFARTFPFAAIIAAVTVVSLVLSREEKKLPMTPVTWTFIAFIVWMSIASIFAIHLDQIGDQLIKVYKIMGMTLVVMMLIKTRKHIEALIWTIVISIGFYGVKGGFFTIRTGGADRVWGPSGTFIDGNNEIALALVIVIPLMYYLVTTTKNRWGRYAFYASMFLCALAALGSYSRGALLAIGAMGVFLWLKSKEKVTLGLVMALAVPVLLVLMPSQWYERMDTINDYQADASAMGRVNAWRMAFNLASDRLFGGGFEIYDAGVFQRYAPNPADVHAAHSIYFQILGEHGFIGLFIYLLLGFLTWRSASWVAKNTARLADMKWANSMATMIQVSLLGFAVGGAFLSLAYFDVPYYLMAAVVALRILIQKEMKEKAALGPSRGAKAIHAVTAPEPPSPGRPSQPERHPPVDTNV